ncbi:MAG TPA: acVLRF1 family peptidyl-tRNA hydrolase [Dehalococcoidia bacterium]|jgi:hypothetical protein|nr:acVLRF1 family peptidyl-tRNA hydrolase [Dehalococcoidia bacterium]
MNHQPAVWGIQSGQFLSRPRLETLLASLTPSGDTPSSSLYLRPGEVIQFLETTNPEAGVWAERLSQLSDAVLNSDTGLAGLRAGGHALVIVPPFPVQENKLAAQWDVAPLLELLAADYLVGVVLLRLGRFSVAVYQGDRLLASKTDARYVKGRHRAGGSSQRRFERIREGQMRRIYDKTCEAVAAQFEPLASQLDYVVLGGERITLNNFRKVCPYLERFQDRILGRLLNIRDPKRDALEEVGRLLWQSRVYPIEW